MTVCVMWLYCLAALLSLWNFAQTNFKLLIPAISVINYSGTSIKGASERRTQLK